MSVDDIRREFLYEFLELKKEGNIDPVFFIQAINANITQFPGEEILGPQCDYNGFVAFLFEIFSEIDNDSFRSAYG